MSHPSSVVASFMKSKNDNETNLNLRPERQRSVSFFCRIAPIARWWSLGTTYDMPLAVLQTVLCSWASSNTRDTNELHII
jgi:hypothetical protein